VVGERGFRDGELGERAKEPGGAIGLAWTAAGGEGLVIEGSEMAGGGSLTLTGQLGEVMKESARAALSWPRAPAKTYGIDPDFFTKAEMHVHVPAGAIPKDGPSAGVTMATALASALLRIPVRKDVAMTGEITLRGRVLPIGGLKDKVLAAHRADIFTVIIPKENRKDLKDIPKKVLRVMKIIWVDHMDSVLRVALRIANREAFLREPSRSVDWRGAARGVDGVILSARAS